MYNGPRRKKLRLENYDYSQSGFYFVTICTQGRENFFGEIIDGKIMLNTYGKITQEELLKTEEMRKEIYFDMFVIMPNHLHLIIVINNNVQKNIVNVGNAGMHSGKDIPQGQEITKNTLSNTIQGFKSSITRKIRKECEDFNFGWQKSFFDKVIQNNEQLEKTRIYIKNNPLKWEMDINNPENIK